MPLVTPETTPDSGAQTPLPLVALILNFLFAISVRRRLVITICTLFLLAGTFVAWYMKPRYTATTSILPPQQSSSASSGLLAQLGGLGAFAGLSGGALKSPLAQYAGFVQSETVQEALVQQFDLVRLYRVKRESAARAILAQNTGVDDKSKDGLLKISVTDKNAERSAQMANAYVTQLKRLTEHLAISDAAQRRLFLEQQLQQVKNHLAEAEEDLKRTEESTGVIQVDAQGRALIQAAEMLRAQIAAKQVAIRSLSVFDAQGNPDLEVAQQQLMALQTQLAALNGKQAIGLTGTKGQISNAGLQYVRKQREVKYQETLFEILARQYEAAKMDEAHDGSVLQIVDEAHAPDHPSKPNRPLIVVGFLLVGVVLACSWVLLSQAWSNLLSNSDISRSYSLLRGKQVAKPAR